MVSEGRLCTGNLERLTYALYGRGTFFYESDCRPREGRVDGSLVSSRVCLSGHSRPRLQGCPYGLISIYGHDIQRT